jgi:hypothetical protein
MRPSEGYFHMELLGGVFRTRNWIIIAFAVLAVLLGLWGFSRCSVSDCQTTDFPDKLFRTVDLIRLNTHFTLRNDPWQLVLAQLMMPMALVFGAFRLFLSNMRRDVKVVMTRRMRGHVIVCGIGDTGRHIAEHLADAGHKVVAIASNNQEPNALICERRGIVVLQGDGMDAALLKIAGLKRARSLLIACGSDATNIEIGLRADAASSKRNHADPLTICVELRNAWLYNQIVTQRSRLNSSAASQFRLFNLNANAARLLLRSEGFTRALHAAHPTAPHLLVVGQGQTLGEVIVQAIECIFAKPDCQFSVTIVGPHAKAMLEGLLLRFPGLSDSANVVAQDYAFDDNARWPDIEALIAKDEPFAAVIDLEDEVATMKAALRFRRIFDSAGLLQTPIYARVWQQNRLGAFLQDMERDPSQPERVAVFGDLETLTEADQLLEQQLDILATSTHDAYRASTALDVPGWSNLSEEMKQSNRAFADHMPIKLDMIGLQMTSGNLPMELSDMQVEELARAEHLRWSQSLKLRGWKHGPHSDIGKMHPLLKDWQDLDDAAKETNREMVRRIPAIANAAGYKVVARE